ncbi:hypothetical protein [Devosia aurantiaca]|uniref:hypothetical protein n=1 Tax=Devosia aurantiaca TaxID=2714858 RepID=UPI001A987CC3|nr:hypothetical protein [Devosia aurantiaca]
MITSPYLVAGGNRAATETTPGTIIFWASQGAMHQGLVQAIRAYLPAYQVILVEQLPDPASTPSLVSLVLLDLGPEADCADAVALSRKQFPDSALGLVMRSCDREGSKCDTLFEHNEIQGLLPLELKLEVWLAALSLLVQGGEYYPPPFRAAHIVPTKATGPTSRLRLVSPSKSRQSRCRQVAAFT